MKFEWAFLFRLEHTLWDGGIVNKNPSIARYSGQFFSWIWKKKMYNDFYEK